MLLFLVINDARFGQTCDERVIDLGVIVVLDVLVDGEYFVDTVQVQRLVVLVNHVDPKRMSLVVGLDYVHGRVEGTWFPESDSLVLGVQSLRLVI